jgi:hypothetical protein
MESLRIEALRKRKTGNCKGPVLRTIGMSGSCHKEAVSEISPMIALSLCAALLIWEKVVLGLLSRIPDSRTSDGRLSFGDRNLDIDSFLFPR